MHEDVTSAWDRTVEQWDEPARHDALLALVVQHKAFAWAAARYKEKAGDPIADRQLERLRKAATATLLASASTRSDAEQQPYKKTLIWMLVLVVFAVVALVVTWLMSENKKHKRPPPTSPAARDVMQPQANPTPARP